MERFFNMINPKTKEVEGNVGEFISNDDLKKLIKIDNTEYDETPCGFVNYCNDLIMRVQVICKIIHKLKFVHKWNETLIRYTKILRGYNAVNNGEGVFVTNIKPYIAKLYDMKKSFIDNLIKSDETISDVIDIDITITEFINALDELISVQFSSDFVMSTDGAKYLLCKISSFFNVLINNDSDDITVDIIENIKTTTTESKEHFYDVGAAQNMMMFVDCAIARCNYANYMKEVVGVKLHTSVLIETELDVVKTEPGHMSKIYPVIKKKTRNKLIKKVDNLNDGERIMKSFCKNINSAVESAAATDIGDKSYISFIEKAVECIRKINLVDGSDTECCCNGNCTCKTAMDEVSESFVTMDVTPHEYRVTGVFKSKDYLSIKDLIELLVLRLSNTGEIHDAENFICDAINDNGTVGVQFIFRDRSEDESQRRIYETDTYVYVTDDGDDDFRKVINEIADEFIINDEDLYFTIKEEMITMQLQGPIEISVVLSAVDDVNAEDDDVDDRDSMSEFGVFKRKKNFTFEELMKRFAKCREDREDSDKINEFIRKASAKTGVVSGRIEFKGDDDSYDYKFSITYDEDVERFITVREIIDCLVYNDEMVKTESDKESGGIEGLNLIISRIQNHSNIRVTMTFFAPAGTYVEVFGDETDED